MEQTLPKSCKVQFDDPNKLHSFHLTICPEESYWVGGKFKFLVTVPEDYNIVVSISLIMFLLKFFCFMNSSDIFQMFVFEVGYSVVNC